MLLVLLIILFLLFISGGAFLTISICDAFNDAMQKGVSGVLGIPVLFFCYVLACVAFALFIYICSLTNMYC